MSTAQHNLTGLSFSSRQATSDADILSVARQAEAFGYDSIWIGESWGRDAFTVLTMIACHTESLRLGTGMASGTSTPCLGPASILRSSVWL